MKRTQALKRSTLGEVWLDEKRLIRLVEQSKKAPNQTSSLLSRERDEDVKEICVFGMEMAEIHSLCI
jgi:hypothetical protein